MRMSTVVLMMLHAHVECSADGGTYRYYIVIFFYKFRLTLFGHVQSSGSQNFTGYTSIFSQKRIGEGNPLLCTYHYTSYIRLSPVGPCSQMCDVKYASYYLEDNDSIDLIARAFFECVQSE